MTLNAMLAGHGVDGCTCEMVRDAVWDWNNGPEPAEWEQDPLCWVHPSEPGTWWDPIQSATPEWRAFVEMVTASKAKAYSEPELSPF